MKVFIIPAVEWKAVENIFQNFATKEKSTAPRT